VKFSPATSKLRQWRESLNTRCFGIQPYVINLGVNFGELAGLSPAGRRFFYSGRFHQPLMHRVARLQREGRNLDIKLLAARTDHLISAAHRAHRGLERAPRRVLE
jgi:hypothetical protein